uniref:Uncharacterized protein n=1 Tax=viral metagenome TaxID=1070528 RepID=A0A6C0AEG2_9ZZZZ
MLHKYIIFFKLTFVKKRSYYHENIQESTNINLFKYF